MVTLDRSVKFWILASLISLFGYVFYVTKGSWTIFFGYLANIPSDVFYVGFTGSVFWGGHIGLTARFIGVLLGLSAAYLVWAIPLSGLGITLMLNSRHQLRECAVQ
jgi:hypothetical protein